MGCFVKNKICLMLIPGLLIPAICLAQTSREFIQSKLQSDWSCQSVKSDAIILCNQISHPNNVFYFARKEYSETNLQPESAEKSLREYNKVLLLDQRCKKGFSIKYNKNVIKPGVSASMAEYICRISDSSGEYGIDKFIIGSSATFIAHLGYDMANMDAASLEKYNSIKYILYEIDELSN